MRLRIGDQYFVRLDEICEHHIKCMILKLNKTTVEITPNIYGLHATPIKIVLTRKEFKERSFKT